ncbi:MAG: DNA-binding response regulator [Acidobacteria bacterium]|nr:DNA-binding response regulator [Acidobacteriota bacterium]
MHILVAEDDHDIAELISHYLKKAGWSPHVAAAGDQALAYIRNHPVDVVILDLMLPGMSGLDVCQALRADRATTSVPIIMLTARTEEADRVRGLELGADDYVAKPFSPNELVARIRALVRRSRRSEPTEAVLRLGPIVVDLSRHTVSNAGREVNLTAKEFMLLQYFLEHRGRVLSRDLLLSDVWDYRYTGGTRTVDVHVRRLREKLPVLVDALITVKQFGYKLGGDEVP